MPIQTFLFDRNYIIEGWSRDRCPLLDQYNAENTKLEKDHIKFFMEKILPELQQKGVNVEEILGKDAKIDLMGTYLITDYVISFGYLKKYPLIDLNFLKRLDFFLGMHYHIYFFNNPKMIKYQNTYTFRKLGVFLQKALEGNRDGVPAGYPSFFSLLMHDSNLIGFLKTIGVSSYECNKKSYEDNKATDSCYGNPSYASSLLFELAQNQKTKEYRVNVKFNGKQMKICSSENGSCNFQEFQGFLKANSLEGDFRDLFNTYCRSPEVRKSKSIFLRVLFVLCLVAIGVMLYLIYQSMKKLSDD